MLYQNSTCIIDIILICEQSNMTSSKFTSYIDLKNVNIKSEHHMVWAGDMVSMEYVYGLIFEAFEPSNNDKLEVKNKFCLTIQ